MGGILVAVLIAVGMDTDAPVEGVEVMVTGISIEDASVKVLVEVPVSWSAPEPLIVVVQVAVAVFARSQDTKAEILAMKPTVSKLNIVNIRNKLVLIIAVN